MFFFVSIFFELLTKRPGLLTTFPHLCCIQLLSNYTLNRQDEMLFHYKHRENRISCRANEFHGGKVLFFFFFLFVCFLTLSTVYLLCILVNFSDEFIYSIFCKHTKY